MLSWEQPAGGVGGRGTDRHGQTQTNTDRTDRTGRTGRTGRHRNTRKVRRMTIRKQIIELLETGDHDAREISQLLSISEKEVYTHMPHVKKSVLAMGKKLIILPASCQVCGYRFKDRNRPKKPSRCPECKSERISNPRYSLG